MDPSLKKLIDHSREHMGKALVHLDAELQKVRAGKANPAMLEGIRAIAYGNEMPLNQLGTVTAPDNRMLVVQPFDKSTVGAIEKAIRESGMGLNPQNDGGLIRVPIPQLTEDRRKQLVKQAKEEGETAKIAIRNIRRENLEKIKKAKSDGVPEDDIKTAETEMQKLTDDHIGKVDAVMKKKEAEIMTI
jgi:ribosome recycling factor